MWGVRTGLESGWWQMCFQVLVVKVVVESCLLWIFETSYKETYSAAPKTSLQVIRSLAEWVTVDCSFYRKHQVFANSYRSLAKQLWSYDGGKQNQKWKPFAFSAAKLQLFKCVGFNGKAKLLLWSVEWHQFQSNIAIPPFVTLWSYNLILAFRCLQTRTVIK